MSNVSYDLDTSGGLMPLIRALIKPPDEDLNAQKPKKPQHPYYKRPGKGHNHDSCDACGEGGDLICCDRCPASFHLGCYDPPLDENDIPAGLWLCRECRASDEKAPSSRSSRAQSPVDSKSDVEKKTRTLRNNRANSKRSKDGDEEAGEEHKEPEKELTPMEVLVRAARIMNPRQFDLPDDMKFKVLFPGTEKEGGKNGNSSLVTVDAWGCVPLPAKSCYVCEGTCKSAPLLQCDYCPLLFHQDCLDPPLTALPTGRWMCPNHVEQYIDWKLVNSISATERVALWEKFSGPVDQHAIKLDFIRRARNRAPCFREKIPVEQRPRVVVPPMVKHHYSQPAPLMPSRREHVRCTNVLKRLKMDPEFDATEEEDDDAPKHQICMNLSCPQYYGGTCTHAHQSAVALKGVTDEDANDDLNAISAPKDEKPTDDSSELSDSDFEYFTASVKKRKSPTSARHRERLSLRAGGDAESLLAAVDEQLKKLDERLVKLLAWQRLQQVLVGERCYGPWREGALSGAAASAVHDSIDRARLAKHGFKHVALPSELLSRAERERIAAKVWGGPPAPQSPPRASHSPQPPHVPAKATLCEVLRPARSGLGDGLGQPIPMRLSSLTVGTDSGCDVRLHRPGCRALSRHHAVIFMDEVTRHFELINYSEWGSRVNGVLYACDATFDSRDCLPRAERADERGLPAEPNDAEARAEAVRDIVRSRAPPPLKINGSLKACAPEPWSCGCRAPLSAAWEGSALLPHGALLQFGCAMYVFSITHAKPEPPGEPHPDPAI